jgi:DnaJ family protein C protein 28
MASFDKVVEEIIQKAMQNGEFDHLKGMGKPLNLADNPNEPEDWRLANQILRNNGMLYPWMDEAKSIDMEREKARRELHDTWLANVARRQKQSARDRFEQAIEALNRRILRYNLQVPSAVFQRVLLDADTEFNSAIQSSSPATQGE